MAKEKEIVCPSGLSGTIRNWKISEGNVLANKRLAKQNKMIDALMGAVWLRTKERGLCEYEVIGPGPKWQDVLSGDRMYALIQARILTFGPSYDFKYQCDNGSCERFFWWEIDLSELPVQKLTKENAATFNKGNRFTAPCESLDGKSITFQLMTGLIQRKAQRAQEENQDEPLTTSLAHRILGVEGQEFSKKNTIRQWLNDQGLDLALDLLEVLDSVDCGVDTSIEVECPHCNNEMEVDLPLGKEFFMPARKRKRARMADSSQT